MIVQTDFLEHHKTLQLIQVLQDERAPLYLLRLWAHCQNRKTHGFPIGSKTLLASVCRYEIHNILTPSEFHDAMVECGWIDECEKDGKPHFYVHDWEEVNRSLIASWRNGDKGGRPKKTKSAKNPRDTHGGGYGTPDKIREDKIREKRRKEKATSPSDFYLRFREIHPSCAKVGQIAFDATVMKCVVGNTRPDVAEALDAFERHMSGASYLKVPLREFEKYLRKSVREEGEKIKGRKKPKESLMVELRRKKQGVKTDGK